MNRHLMIGLLLLYALPAPAQQTLELEAAVAAAVANDPWLSGSTHREEALRSEAAVAGALPDPRIDLLAANLPVDTFNLNQEPMTQLAIGVSQRFPRGDSRALGSRQKRELAAGEPLLRIDRHAQVRSEVTNLWLAAFEAQRSTRLIEGERALFEQMVDLTRVAYTTALGATRQHDLIRAELELTRLDDRLTELLQTQETAQQRLAEWIGPLAQRPLPDQLPLRGSTAISVAADPQQRQTLYERVSRHPSLRALDQRIAALDTGVTLARQKYRPEWGVNARYGYRDDDPLGVERADFFSVGVTFEVPLFTSNRTDREVSAAASRAEALRTDRQLLARHLVAELEASLASLQRLNERGRLYRERLLPQMAEQAAASLAAYNNDDGDFAEAVRARIAELNARIDALNLAVRREQVIARLDYLLTQAAAPAKAGGTP